ncbi:hypothetical protein [Sinimarinibacterium thermocellulolyticum]|uniref:Uncharacterized protein n=1 Tax=Sinimarinibacterium thermocellulolyticum TaxID=3170016 RepID=A0ABV2AAI0_9GAMM
MPQPDLPASILPRIAAIPARPPSQWPVGVRLRFRPDAEMSPTHEALRGKPLLVLSALRLIGPNDGRWSWRQQVLSLTTGRVGWARPDQLDLPIDDDGWMAF